MDRSGRRGFGCGCGVIVVAAVVLVIALVGWGVTVFGDSNPLRRLEPVPPGVPPAGGEAVPPIDTSTPGRNSEKLGFWSKPISDKTLVNQQALNAYGQAELVAAQRWPQCHLRWNTLAGIGWVETRHGTYNGDLLHRPHLDADGVATPKIVGVPLDGSPGFAEIQDTDGGELDGDAKFDRAVGPMQFIASSWRQHGHDGNGDGVKDPSQIDDAALSAADLLCSGGNDLATPEGWTTAIRAYNNSNSYVNKVRDAAASYSVPQPAAAR